MFFHRHCQIFIGFAGRNLQRRYRIHILPDGPQPGSHVILINNMRNKHFMPSTARYRSQLHSNTKHLDSDDRKNGRIRGTQLQLRVTTYFMRWGLVRVSIIGQAHFRTGYRSI